MESSREDGSRERDQIIESAKEYAERLRSDAKSVTEQEFESIVAKLTGDPSQLTKNTAPSAIASGALFIGQSS